MSPARLLAVTIAAAGSLALGTAAASAASAAARGIGATFPQPAYARWATLFSAETGGTVSYEGAGSGAGLKAVEDATAAFGASDVPLDGEQQRAEAVVQVPTLVGGIVPVVNLPGIGPGDLVLDGQTLADLLTKTIAFWDDPAIVGRNPHLPLPHLAVTPVRRSDPSGTTAVMAAYLARVSKRDDGWFALHPAELPPVGQPAEGSRGVAAAVAATAGAIGYLGFDFAQANRLPYADLVNPAGRVVQPTLASIAAAAESADWSRGLAPVLVARDGGASWPIVTATYVLMRRTNPDGAPVRTAVLFFDWATRNGGPAAEDLGFVLPPERVEAEVRLRLWEIRDAKGHSLAPPGATDPSAGATP